MERLPRHIPIGRIYLIALSLIWDAKLRATKCSKRHTVLICATYVAMYIICVQMSLWLECTLERYFIAHRLFVRILIILGIKMTTTSASERSISVQYSTLSLSVWFIIILYFSQVVLSSHS